MVISCVAARIRTRGAAPVNGAVRRRSRLRRGVSRFQPTILTFCWFLGKLRPEDSPPSCAFRSIRQHSAGISGLSCFEIESMLA